MIDPLNSLPAEIVLRVIDFASPTDVAHLLCLNKSWNEFIDQTHQDHIYSSLSKTDHPSNCRDFSFLNDTQSFARCFEGVTGWKDLCKRQTLLKHSWLSEKPTTTESIMQIGNSPVWRFRPDFKRRFIVSTSQSGGVNVTDMDDGSLLWSLGREDVRPYAHLEYQDGTAVWDRMGNAIEVWKVDDDNRGTFRRETIFQHECETRGFQLSFDTLCVVSSEGEAFVYDMSSDPPSLKTHMDIERDAVGHLYQNQDVIVCSIGQKGYHVHSKETGAFVGILQPNTCTNTYHIHHPNPPPERDFTMAMQGPTTSPIFPPTSPRTDRLIPLHLKPGPHPERMNPLSREDDEWGAGMIDGDFMVGVSRGGRLYICSDWQGALASPRRAAACSAIIECESDGSTFDLGGWLSIKNNKVLFEVNDRIYIFTLNKDGLLPETGDKRLPAWAMSSSSAPQLTVPVSFMAVYDDCLMTTYTTIGWRQAEANDPLPADANRRRPFATKAIRIISLAPSFAPTADEDAATGRNVAYGRDAARPILQYIVSLLGGEDPVEVDREDPYDSAEPSDDDDDDDDDNDNDDNGDGSDGNHAEVEGDESGGF